MPGAGGFLFTVCHAFVPIDSFIMPPFLLSGYHRRKDLQSATGKLFSALRLVFCH